MSGQATGWVLRYGPHPDHVDREGRPYGARARGFRSVLTAVADAANADGNHAHPGIEGVMRGSLYGRRQSIAILDDLVQEGWLDIEEVGGGRGQATVYSLPKMAATNGAVVAPNVPETVQSPTERVQSDDETVQSRLHPNGLSNVTKQRTGRSRSFPDAFIVTKDMREWHKQTTPHVDLDLETRQFADHHRAKGDQMVRWDLAWRTWMRNAAKWSRPARQPNPTVAPDLRPEPTGPELTYAEEHDQWMAEHDPSWKPPAE